MLLNDLLAVLEDYAPTRYAESWDNVGLLVGDAAQEVSRVLLTIDYTPAVAQEAARDRCEAVISYHPPIFDGLKRISGASLIYDAIRRGIAIYSPHTALDVADGGTNDMLADALGLDEVRPLRLIAPTPSEYKLVTFVPAESAEKMASALFAAGAGRIGDYSCCSFRTPGTGTFFGQTGLTNPAVGQAGQLERVEELRVETVVPIGRVDAVIRALRASHPYEEPAFDLVQLAAHPQSRGQGRIGTFAATVERSAVIERIKQQLELDHLLVAGPADGTITSAACCAGACGDLLTDALSQGAELYLTGELRHHDALRAAGRGMTVVCTLHSNSERAVLKRVAAHLAEYLPQLNIQISRADRDPFTIL